MKTFRIIGAMLLVSLISLGNIAAQTKTTTKTTTKKARTTEAMEDTKEAAAGMNTYFVSAAHSPEQCQTIMDEMKAKGDKSLSKFKWGCASGDHTVYAFVQAASADEARNMLPMDVQTNAKVVKVETYSVKKMGAMHKEGTQPMNEGMQKEGMQKEGMHKEGMQKEGMQKEGMKKPVMQKAKPDTLKK